MEEQSGNTFKCVAHSCQNVYLRNTSENMNRKHFYDSEKILLRKTDMMVSCKYEHIWFHFAYYSNQKILFSDNVSRKFI